MRRLPGSVLFACDYNAVRSPIAEGLLKQRFGTSVYVDSVGVRNAEINTFAIAVMEEVGVNMANHQAKTFGQLEDTSFDYIVSLSPAAQHSAVELTRTMACDLLFWHTNDATAVRGNREAILGAYREVRNSISAKIGAWLGDANGPSKRQLPETP